MHSIPRTQNIQQKHPILNKKKQTKTQKNLVYRDITFTHTLIIIIIHSYSFLTHHYYQLQLLFDIFQQ